MEYDVLQNTKEGNVKSARSAKKTIQPRRLKSFACIIQHYLRDQIYAFMQWNFCIPAEILSRMIYGAMYKFWSRLLPFEQRCDRPCDVVWRSHNCIIMIFDFMFQLNAPFVYYIYEIPLHVSSNIVLIIRRIRCIHTTSGSLYVSNSS